MRAPAESMHAGANGTEFGITSAAGYFAVGDRLINPGGVSSVGNAVVLGAQVGIEV
jgi:hypothetical protein